MEVNLADQVRRGFLDFFCKHGHKKIESAPLVPHNDPSLLFVNAGMVPFKDYFLQNKQPPSKNIVTCQKCVRAGGKHNDLENVGHTKRHHTFFEMLGNFSFGGYFKKKAIELAWQFLTQELNLEKERLYITVYKDDQEAFDIWKDVTNFSDKKIIRISTDDNFWQMGEEGPCGPCSEIFYDHGPHLKGQLPSDNSDTGDRYVEIWNLVFMQYMRQKSGDLTKLPSPCIDTGMGLERICAVLEKTDDNFCTQGFAKLINHSKQITQKNDNEIAHRVIADHLRSCAFLIADGVMPSNTGRGYVLRRIIRRAVRYINNLGVENPILCQIFAELKKQMSKAYPELLRASSLIASTLSAEESAFYSTLKNGLAILKSHTENLKKGDALPGKTAFLLYDTYGFPLDLTLDILKEQSIQVDQNGFEKEMELQKSRAKKSWVGSGEKANLDAFCQIFKKHGKTNFLRDQTTEENAKIIAIFDQNNNLLEQTDQKEVCVVLEKTTFYAESGGQEGDKGLLICDGKKLEVFNTTKTPDGIFIHHCKPTEDVKASIGQSVTTSIDIKRRSQLAKNHSATHILHHALRKVLGDHVVQKGSLVACDKLRFDFSHQKAITDKQLEEIEDCVNQMIWLNFDVDTQIQSVDEAIKAGAMALFGEKYDKDVRVVTMGNSIELCGGTHVKNTGSIGVFKIISEGSVASGIRRIEAITHYAVLDHNRKRQAQAKLEIQSLENKIKKDIRSKQQEIYNLYRRIIDQCEFKKLKTADGISVLIKEVEKVPQDILQRVITEKSQDQFIKILVVKNAENSFLSLIIPGDVNKKSSNAFNAKTIVEGCKKIPEVKIGIAKEGIAQVIVKNKKSLKDCLRSVCKDLGIQETDGL